MYDCSPGLKDNSSFHNSDKPKSLDIDASIFKYKIGAEVHHKCFRKNCIVRRRMVIEDIESSYLGYELAEVGSDATIIYEEVSEKWLESGHRVE